MVHQHGPFLGRLDRLGHILAQQILVVNDDHRPAAEHERGTHQHRIADLRRGRRGLFHIGGDRASRLEQMQVVDQMVEFVAVLRPVDVFRRSPDDLDPAGFQLQRQLERRLPAELHDHAVGFFPFVDMEHVFQRHRFEIQFVARVVVGGHCFRVAVHHDRFEARIPERKRSVDAAVIELDPLPDPVGTAAKDHDLLPARLLDRLVVLAVGGVIVRRIGFELARTGIDQTVNRQDAQGFARLVDGNLVGMQCECDLPVGVTELLDLAEQGGIGLQLFQRARSEDLVFEIRQLADRTEEPGIDLGQFTDLFDRPAPFESFAQMEQPLAVRTDQLRPQLAVGQRGVFAVFPVQTEPGPAGFQRADRLLQRLFEGPPDAHGLADRLHLGGKGAVRSREFFEGETRYLGHHIVDRGFETGGSLPRDVVDELVQRIADGELGRDLGDREAGGLGCQRAGTGNAGVHFNDDHPAVAGVDAPLDVGSAGLHADRTHDGQRGVAHFLVFAVGQGLRRGDGDAVAGVDAHRVHVFDRTDDHGVVLGVAHDFELEFFPADQGFLDQDFGIHAGGEPAGNDRPEFIHVMRDPAAGAAEGESRTDDQRQGPDLLCDGQRFVHAVRGTAFRQVEPDRTHGLLEQVAVFGTADDLGFGSDHLHAVTFQDAGIVEFQREIQRGLSAERGQDRIRTFPADDLMQDVLGQRFDIGPVREIGVGHDGGRVAVDQQDFIAFLFEGFARLGPGIVEFTSLADDDGARSDQHDLLDVSSLRHMRVP